MDKRQTTFINLSNSLMVTFGVLNNKENIFETGFLAGFLFFLNFQISFQFTKLNISYNFIHHKTLQK